MCGMCLCMCVGRGMAVVFGTQLHYMCVCQSSPLVARKVLFCGIVTRSYERHDSKEFAQNNFAYYRNTREYCCNVVRMGRNTQRVPRAHPSRCMHHCSPALSTGCTGPSSRLLSQLPFPRAVTRADDRSGCLGETLRAEGLLGARRVGQGCIGAVFVGL